MDPTLTAAASDERREREALVAERELRATFIDKTVLVHITDGRAFEGTFVCVDDQSNVILAGTREYRLIPREVGDGSAPADESRAGHLTSRSVEMVMIPGHHITRCEVKTGWTAALATAAGTGVSPFPSDPSLYT